MLSFLQMIQTTESKSQELVKAMFCFVLFFCYVEKFCLELETQRQSDEKGRASITSGFQ